MTWTIADTPSLGQKEAEVIFTFVEHPNYSVGEFCDERATYLRKKLEPVVPATFAVTRAFGRGRGIISPDFELIDDGNEASMGWFDSDSEAAAQFIPFAQANDGGLFAYWKCETCTPITYLASECEGTRVVAQSTSELLSIIAFGSDSYVIDIEHTDQDEEWNGPDKVPESLIDFRGWLNSELGIAPAGSPRATIKEAMAASPDLMAWVREWQDRKYGTQAK